MIDRDLLRAIGFLDPLVHELPHGTRELWYLGEIGGSFVVAYNEAPGAGDDRSCLNGDTADAKDIGPYIARRHHEVRDEAVGEARAGDDW